MLCNKNISGGSGTASLALGMWLLACAPAVLAAAPNLDEARRLLAAGQAEQSAALLESELLDFAGDADFDFLLGQAWLKAGKDGQALFAFERVLMVNPGNVQARLYAAQISVARADAAYARELLQPLADQSLPDTQQQELDRLREAIAGISAAGPLSMRAYLASGIGADDNVTNGPARSSLLIPALGPTSLGTAAQGSDTVGMAEAGLLLQKAVGEDTWLSGDGSLHQGFNRTRKDVTERYYNLSLGVLRRSGNEYFGAALMNQEYFISNAAYRSTQGVRLNWAHAFADSSLLTGYFQQLTFTFPVQTIENATRRIIGVTRETTTDSGGVWQYGVYGGRQVSVSKPHFSFHLTGLSLGGSMQLGKDLAVSAGAIYEVRNHDAVDALYLLTRRDTVRSLGLAADYRLGESWHLIPRYSYIRNASNAALYDYTRNTFMLQLRWEFDNEKE